LAEATTWRTAALSLLIRGMRNSINDCVRRLHEITELKLLKLPCEVKCSEIWFHFEVRISLRSLQASKYTLFLVVREERRKSPYSLYIYNPTSLSKITWHLSTGEIKLKIFILILVSALQSTVKKVLQASILTVVYYLSV
jgi:hypothetical protein